MHLTTTASLFFPFLATLAAGQLPLYPGFRVLWGDDFIGPAGSPPNAEIWETPIDFRRGDRVLTYFTASSGYVQLSGQGTFQIIPQTKAQNVWISGMLRSKKVFTPQPGKVTVLEVSVREGTNPLDTKLGLFTQISADPERCEKGVYCSELDLMSRFNKDTYVSGGVKCASSSANPLFRPLNCLLIPKT